MKHLDLFSGIGGFALAIDRVWPNAEHMFCEIDPFCQEILKKHWPNSKIYGDIKTITKREVATNTRSQKYGGLSKKPWEKSIKAGQFDFLTGGFPCQPFSQAGVRKGTSDDRHLWPEMLRVVSEFKPEWVVAENVSGLLSIENGVVFEQVCIDLEREGYEVWPFVIPACAVGAPHRRDRIWFVAHLEDSLGVRGSGRGKSSRQVLERGSTEIEAQRPDSQSGTANSKRKRHKGHEHQERSSTRHSGRTQWDTHWFEVATRLCRVDDGLPRRLDRNPRLKALGNAIVPQVAEEIFKAIKASPIGEEK